MKCGFAMIFLLSIPALVAAQDSCTHKTAAGARAERSAPVAPFPAWDQRLSFEAHLI